MRQELLYPGEDSYWVAEVPSLPGCISQGKTREEAIENIKEAITLYIEGLQAQDILAKKTGSPKDCPSHAQRSL